MRCRRHPVPHAFAATLLGLSITRVAQGESTPPVDLHWDAPRGCPSQTDVERDIARTIGGRPVGRDPLRARVDVWRSEAGGWKGDIELSAAGQKTRRQVHGDTCEAVESAVAIVIGLAAVHDSVPSSAQLPVEPASGASVAPAPPAPPPPLPFPTPAAAPAVVALEAVSAPRGAGAPSVATPHPTPSRPVPLFVGASALLDVGSLPSVTPGVELFFGWKPTWWQLEVTGAYLASTFTSLETPTTPSQGANVWLAELGARGCAAWSVARLEAGPCVGANASWIHAMGENAHTTNPDTGNTANASFGGRASWHMTRWAAVHVGATLLVPFDRATVRISGATPYRTAAVAFRGALGLDVHF
jgi:hypothetical protein